jgi:hypothetical protein
MNNPSERQDLNLQTCWNRIAKERRRLRIVSAIALAEAVLLLTLLTAIFRKIP